MEWRDQGLIIGTKRHGENAVIIEVMTPEHGRHLGLVRGGRSRKYGAILQPGNAVELVWRARLAEHLGAFTVEAQNLRGAKLLQNRAALSISQLICEHLRVLPERESHPLLFAQANAIHENEADGFVLGKALVRFEMHLLRELGFGIDTTSCALSGETTGLCYISPKTGKAVTEQAGAPYKEKLLALPQIFGGTLEMDAKAELTAAFALTGHFLDMHIWQTRQISPPSMRERVIEMLNQQL